MLPDRVSNPGPVTYESGALPIAPRDPAMKKDVYMYSFAFLLMLGSSFNPLVSHLPYMLRTTHLVP